MKEWMVRERYRTTSLRTAFEWWILSCSWSFTSGKLCSLGSSFHHLNLGLALVISYGSKILKLSSVFWKEKKNKKITAFKTILEQATGIHRLALNPHILTQTPSKRKTRQTYDWLIIQTYQGTSVIRKKRFLHNSSIILIFVQIERQLFPLKT